MVAAVAAETTLSVPMIGFWIDVSRSMRTLDAVRGGYIVRRVIEAEPDSKS
jgi:hypothetical protein